MIILIKRENRNEEIDLHALQVKSSLRISCGITSYFLNKRLSRERYAPWQATDLQVDVSKSYS